MRLNVYTEELLFDRFGIDAAKPAEIVTADYVSSSTGQPMKNWAIRIFVKSHPDLHFVPDRDDDRSAITFWCGDKSSNIQKFIEMLMYIGEQDNLERWRNRVKNEASKAEVAEAERCKAPNAGGIGTVENCPGEECRSTGKCQVA